MNKQDKTTGVTQLQKDLGWRQAMLPRTITGGSGIDTGVTSVGGPNDTGEGRTGVRLVANSLTWKTHQKGVLES